MSLYIGLMSGTSLDGIDAVLVNFDTEHPALIETHSHAIPDEFRRELLALCGGCESELDRFGAADRQMGRLLADSVHALLKKSGLPSEQVRAIGSHGQTVRHRPATAKRSRDSAFTLQLGDPNTIAELTGIRTVADFRRRDIAAGGQGAPLVPAFHRAAFAMPGEDRVIANIGGMANITVLAANGRVTGFDTGPGNVLMDSWIAHCRNQRYDKDGNWARTGSVHQALLGHLLDNPYYSVNGPKTTGREHYGLQTLTAAMTKFPALPDADVQATLLELTAVTLTEAILQQGLLTPGIYLCGGGAANCALRDRLAERLDSRRVNTTQALGMNPDWVEAAAFAWLAKAALDGICGNVAAVTGATGDRIVGAIHSP